jgi:catechol 2,3-dioxygenase-like lactoylglutathione lyase family enzyme
MEGAAFNMISSFDHVQVSIEPGRLDEALAFYVDFLGFARVPKPADMRQSGAWLTSGTVNLHLGEDINPGVAFTPSPHAHPAMRVDNFDALFAQAGTKGFKARIDKGPAGFKRGSIWDPFGNRIELMQKL